MELLSDFESSKHRFSKFERSHTEKCKELESVRAELSQMQIVNIVSWLNKNLKLHLILCNCFYYCFMLLCFIVNFCIAYIIVRTTFLYGDLKMEGFIIMTVVLGAFWSTYQCLGSFGKVERGNIWLGKNWLGKIS